MIAHQAAHLTPLALAPRLFIRGLLMVLMVTAFTVFGSRDAKTGKYHPTHLLWLSTLAFLIAFTATAWIPD